MRLKIVIERGQWKKFLAQQAKLSSQQRMGQYFWNFFDIHKMNLSGEEKEFMDKVYNEQDSKAALEAIAKVVELS